MGLDDPAVGDDDPEFRTCIGGGEDVVRVVDTTSPNSIAASFTGLGESPLPRPRRLSMRVMTRTTSWPAWTTARSGPTAISGVPR